MPVASILGGIIGQQGSQSGGDMAWGAANQANNQNNAEAVRGRNAMTPWTGSGTSALGRITKLLGLGELTQEGNTDGIYWVKPFADPGAARAEASNAFMTSPGYEFRVGEGVKARDRAAAARGMVLSGGQQKALTQFGQDAGSEEFTNYFNQLLALSGSGQQAQSSANSTSGSLVGAGSNALFQGGVARGSAYERGANSLASGIGRGVQNAFTLGGMAMGGFGGGGVDPQAKWNQALLRGRDAGYVSW